MPLFIQQAAETTTYDHTLIFQNSKGDLLLLAESPYRLVSLEGTAATPALIQTSTAPFQDGTTFIDSLLQPRTIDCEVHILGDSLTDIFEKRRTIQHICNPKLKMGKLIYTNTIKRYVIDAIPDGSPSFPSSPSNTLPNFQRSFFSFFCPDPAWRDFDITEIIVSSFEGGFTLNNPLFEFPLDLGTVGQFRTVENLGDLDTPIIATFNGPVTNPRLDNLTTDEFIAVNTTIAQGEKLVINTAFGQKSVTFYNAQGEVSSAFHLIDPTSTFIHLIPGPNELSYAATASAGTDALSIQFYNRYVGV